MCIIYEKGKNSALKNCCPIVDQLAAAVALVAATALSVLIGALALTQQ